LVTLTWQVLLLGGASGVGKTSVSYRLAQHYAVGLTEVDDFAVVLEHMTDPERFPVFHYWRLHTEEALRMDDDAQVAFFRRYAAALEDALALVIGNHIETRTPIILEGDFLLPSLATRSRYGEEEADGQVRAVFLYEEDGAQIARNYLAREGQEQPQRARISRLVDAWLRAEAERFGVPTVPARPWETVLERVIRAVDMTTHNHEL
jgi:2-phosphoglycerate kinase